MDNDLLMQLLRSVAKGKTSIEDAAEKLRHLAIEDIEFAHIDHHRSMRKGFPEVIFGQGKTPGQIIGIIEKMQSQENVILVTRLDAQKAKLVLSHFPQSTYHEDARMLVWEIHTPRIRGHGGLVSEEMLTARRATMSVRGE